MRWKMAQMTTMRKNIVLKSNKPVPKSLLNPQFKVY